MPDGGFVLFDRGFRDHPAHKVFGGVLNQAARGLSGLFVLLNPTAVGLRGLARHPAKFQGQAVYDRVLHPRMGQVHADAWG